MTNLGGWHIGNEDPIPVGVVGMYGPYWTAVISWVQAQLSWAGFDDIYRKPDGTPGTEMPPRPREVARLCAHAIRITLAEDEDKWWREIQSPRLAAAIDSTKADVRMPEGLALRHSLEYLTDREVRDAALMISRWLTGGLDPIVASGHLARWTAGHRLYREALPRAWWLIHGDDLIIHLAGIGAHNNPGRPPMSVSAARSLLSTAVRHRWQAGETTKTALAIRAEISRPTLDAWLTATGKKKDSREQPAP